MSSSPVRWPRRAGAPTIGIDGEGAGRRDVLRWTGLIAAIGAIAGLHFSADPAHVVLHEIYNYLCYVPIILAAYWFGATGGLAAAALTSAAFIPYIRVVWAGNAAHTAGQYAQVVAFHLIGMTVGLLAGAQRRLTERYRAAVISVESVNHQLRESQEHLRRVDRLSALGEIAAGLAHEIHNPLAGVKGALEIVASRVAPGSPEAEFADIGVRELARLEGLVGEFLAFARPHQPALRSTDMHDVINRVVTVLGPEAERAGVALIVERHANVPHLPLDLEQITQVILNVVLNAMQATAGGGQVRIRVSTEPGWAVVDVIDEGPGIDPEHVARLFDPFFTTKPRGTGLGLAISHRIVTAHRGTIEARSGSPSGSVFRIRLPLS